MASVTRDNGTVVNVAGGFMNTPWLTPSYAQTCDNGSFATETFTVGMAGPADMLKSTNFGFSIDSGATIDGIIVTIQKKASNLIKDAELKILNGDGSGGTGSTNKADTSTSWPTSESSVSYGGASDAWGESWTPAKVNSSNFGVVLKVSAHSTGFGASDIAYVDCIQITVHYTAAASGTNIRFGGQTVTKVYQGTTLLNKLYFGDKEVDL